MAVAGTEIMDLLADDEEWTAGDVTAELAVYRVSLVRGLMDRAVRTGRLERRLDTDDDGVRRWRYWRRSFDPPLSD